MDRFLQDLRFSLRMLGRNPAFTAVAVLALALGIGGNAAIFSVVDGVLLKPLALPAADRLVVTQAVSVPDFLDWREQSRVFSGMAAWNATGLNWTGRSEPQRLRAALVSPGFFSTLDVGPALGRAFSAAEHRPGGPQAVVLADGLWQRAFGGDPGVLGRALTLGGASYTVVGVLPRNFRFVGTADVWVPYRFDDPASYNRGSNFLSVVARLAPGVSLRRARTEMADIVARLERLHPENAGRSVQWTPLPEELVANVRRALLALLAAVGLVLLIACADVANLLLARAAARRREIAVRTALGASRRRLLRQLLTESVLLSLLGAGLGLLLARWGTRRLLALMPAGRIPRLEEVGIDGRVLAFTLGVALLTGLAFGLVPGLHASRPDVAGTLKSGAAGAGAAGGRGGARLRDGLVVAQVALALLLLVASGLTLKAFVRLSRVDPGIDPLHVLTLTLNLPATPVPAVEARRRGLAEMLARIETLPGVRAASLTVFLPLGGSNLNGDFHIGGRPDPPPGRMPVAEQRVVAPHYFRAMGIPLLRGRDLEESDGPRAPGAALINETLARRFWPGRDPLGSQVAVDDLQGKPIWMKVVGVVGDVRHFGLGREPRPEIYMPYRQMPADIVSLFLPLNPISLVVRAAGEPVPLAAAVEREVHAVDRDQPVADVRTMESIVAESLSGPRFASLLLGLFGAVALLLAVAGVYAVLAYSVAQRTRETGLRMALGARRGDVLKLVVGQGMALTLGGVSLGLAAALAATRLLQSLLFGVSARDPQVFFGAPLVLGGVALLACLLPARRATRVDPMAALRGE